MILDIILPGIVSVPANFSHSAKVCEPIVCIPSFRVREASSLQYLKASSPIVNTLPGMVIWVRPDSWNATFPIEVTLVGIVIVDRLRQYSNAPRLIVVTVEGIVTLDNFVQPWYLQPIITQYFIDNKSEIWLLFLIAHSKR